MIFSDSMRSLLSMLVYRRPLIIAHMLLTLDQFTPRHQIPVGVFQMGLVSIVNGMGHQFLVRCRLLMDFLPWTSITTVGITIPPPSLHWAVVLVVLISLQFHLWPTGQLGQILKCKDQGLLFIHSLWATGTHLWTQLCCNLRVFRLWLDCP